MHWLSLFLTKIVSEDFSTSFNFSRGSCWQTMITILIKVYFVNIVVDIKPIYLNRHYLFQNKIDYLDKIYFCFAKIKFFKYTLKRETLAQILFVTIAKFLRILFTEHLWTTASEQVTVYHYSACRRQNP